MLNTETIIFIGYFKALPWPKGYVVLRKLLMIVLPACLTVYPLLSLRLVWCLFFTLKKSKQNLLSLLFLQTSSSTVCGEIFFSGKYYIKRTQVFDGKMKDAF